jgi:hypothetical protein
MYSRLVHGNFHGGRGRRQFDSHATQGYNELAELTTENAESAEHFRIYSQRPLRAQR